MKKLRILLLAALMMLVISCGTKEVKTTESTEDFFKSELFSDGMKGPAQIFTGDVYVKMLVTDPDKVYSTNVYNVMFEAGARTFWHSHPGGQLLFATKGTGYYQEYGKPARKLEPGDVVEIAPNVKHWHGAAPDSKFIHFGISTRTQDGPAEWFPAVTDEEYAEATK